jgi:hypothetical protein
MRNRALSITLVFLAALCGCAGGHGWMAGNAAHATLTLAVDAVPSDVAATQYMRAFRDVQCGGASSRGVRLNPSGERQTTSLDVGGEQRIFLYASAETWTTEHVAGDPGSGDLVGHRCESLVSFITVPAHAYFVTQDAQDTTCTLAVVDQITSQPPPDLALHDARRCGQLGKRRTEQ